MEIFIQSLNETKIINKVLKIVEKALINKIKLNKHFNISLDHLVVEN